MAMSSDNGKTWLPPFTAHNDGVQAEHGFVSMFPQANGATFVSWLDGRNSKKAPNSDGHGHGGKNQVDNEVFVNGLLLVWRPKTVEGERGGVEEGLLFFIGVRCHGVSDR